MAKQKKEEQQFKNKSEMIRSWLEGKSFPSVTAAHKEFEMSTGVSISYARFHQLFSSASVGVQLSGGTPYTSEPEVDEDIDLVKIESIHFDKSILTPISSGTELDQLISTERGVMPACITMVPGESGIGKSTVLLDLFGKLKKQHPNRKLLFISTEMNRIHMFKYASRVDIHGVEIMFLGDYNAPGKALEKVLKQGWDFILLDSFQDCIDKCKDSMRLSVSQSETWLLKLMDETRLAQNDRKVYTSFFCVQHMTKGNVYVGSTKVKHMTDAMMELKRDKEMPEYTYIVFSKNRDGACNKRQYFKIHGKEGVQYIGAPIYDDDDDMEA